MTLLFLFAYPAYAQNLSIDEVIGLRKKSIGEAEEFLTSRKWEMLEATEESDTKLGSLSFSYNKSSFDDKAESFIIVYHHSANADFGRVSLQVNNVAKYNNYIARLKVLGYKLSRSYIKDGGLIKIYGNSTNSVRVSTSTHENGFSAKTTTYTFFVVKSDILESMDD